MPDTKIITNRRVGWFFGPATSIGWGSATKAVTNLKNYSSALRIAGTDFGLQASEMSSDPTFSDEAGTQEIGYANFGGNVSNILPDADDTTSTLRRAHDTLKTPHIELAVAQRFGLPDSKPIEAGDEINLFHVVTTAQNTERRPNNYSQTTELVAQDDLYVNYVVPPDTPVAVVIGGGSGGSLASDGTFLWATYQGVRVTCGVTWTSSDPTVARVHPHGYVEYLAVGTTQITATYLGALASSAKAITITT